MAYSQKDGGFKVNIKLLECSVCLGTIRMPKTLKCDHSFCKNCLADILKSKLLKDDVLQAPKDPMHIDCPNCKEESETFSSLGDLKTHFLINQLLDAYNDEIEQKIPPAKCICGERARFQCCRCKDAYCDGCCRKQMGKLCTVQNDEVVSFTKCEMKHFFVKLQKEEDEAICKEHSLSLEFYCTICKDVICMDCFLLSHKQHETKTMKHAKNEALDLVDSIESIRIGNASKYDEIHQRALQVQKQLEESERDVIKQIEEIEPKILGLIASIFKNAKQSYRGLFGESKVKMQEKLNSCEKSVKCNELSQKLRQLGDFQLACMLKELFTAKDGNEEDIVSMVEMMQTLHKKHDAPMLVVDEEAIFNSVIDLFQRINLHPPKYGESLSNQFTFDGYMNGEYLDKVDEEEISEAPNSPNEEQTEKKVVNLNHPSLMEPTPSWYFGNLQKAQAERMLLAFGENGMFIVRDSKIRQNDLALSVRDDDDIKHYRIVCHDSGEFAIFSPGPCFATLLELISHYQERNDSLPIRLTGPFPRKWPILQSIINNDPWEVPRDSISVSKILLTWGHFEQVLVGRWNDSIDVSVRIPITFSRDDFLEQIKVMKKLSHPNIVQLYGHCSHCNPPLIVTEPVKNGYLLNYLREDKGKTLKLPQLIDISLQVASGMAFLEKCNVLHQYIAAENVAVVAKNMFKVDNFRTARFVYGFYMYKKFQVPVKWKSPDSLGPYWLSQKSDVWSFGILLYEIFTRGSEPYPGMEDEEVIRRVARGYRMPKPDGCPEYLYGFMLMCWKRRPDDRPTFGRLKHLLEVQKSVHEGKWDLLQCQLNK